MKIQKALQVGYLKFDAAGKLLFRHSNASDDLPFWPTELDPPRMKIGFPAYFPFPSGDKGETKPSPAGIRLYKPTYGAVRPMGTVAASSYEMLEGI